MYSLDELVKFRYIKQNIRRDVDTCRDVDDMSTLMTRNNKVILQLFVDSLVLNACLCNVPKRALLTSVEYLQVYFSVKSI